MKKNDSTESYSWHEKNMIALKKSHSQSWKKYYDTESHSRHEKNRAPDKVWVVQGVGNNNKECCEQQGHVLASAGL